jgi:tetrahydromethanopterin S-methyltransferase subunit G
MEAMRQSWTDDRLDDFRGEVNRRFDEVDRRFDDVRLELSAQRAETRAEFAAVRSEMGSRFERVEARLDDLNRTLMRFGFGAIVTFVVGFAGMIATQA